MDKIQVSKFVVGCVVASGVSRIVAGIVRNNTSPENLWQKISLLSGSFVIGGIVAGAAKKETDAIIDQIIDGYRSGVALANKVMHRS
jgi:hypothetical protein